MSGLPDDLIDHGPGGGVVHGPGAAGAVAGHSPGVVVVDAVPAQGLQAPTTQAGAIAQALLPLAGR